MAVALRATPRGGIRVADPMLLRPEGGEVGKVGEFVPKQSGVPRRDGMQADGEPDRNQI